MTLLQHWIIFTDRYSSCHYTIKFLSRVKEIKFLHVCIKFKVFLVFLPNLQSNIYKYTRGVVLWESARLFYFV